MAAYSKFIVAFIMSALNLLRVAFGIDIGLDEATVTGIVGAVISVLVFLVPNKEPAPTA